MKTSLSKFKKIFDKIKELKIGLYGDFCLDSYWVLDPRGSEISAETGLQAMAVSTQNYSLGGASNVAANISVLQPKELLAFGVYGKDVFGKEMISQLNAINVNTEGMTVQKENFSSYTFSKLILDGKEQPRIDFGTYNKRTRETDNQILANIRNSVKDVDIFVLNQQVPGSITNLEFIADLNEIISENYDKIFILDSRYFAHKFKNVSFKVNNIEALNLSNIYLDRNETSGARELKAIAEDIYLKNNRPVFITRGDKGILAFDKNGIHETSGIKLSGQLDIVGAGDTVLGAIVCALGVGASIQETIELANLAAAVTVQKMYQTGTASEEEIINLYKNIMDT